MYYFFVPFHVTGEKPNLHESCADLLRQLPPAHRDGAHTGHAYSVRAASECRDRLQDHAVKQDHDDGVGVAAA